MEEVAKIVSRGSQRVSCAPLVVAELVTSSPCAIQLRFPRPCILSPCTRRYTKCFIHHSTSMVLNSTKLGRKESEFWRMTSTLSMTASLYSAQSLSLS